MNDDRRDPTLLIGLHKLAEQNGDGLVPELYDLLTRRPDELEEDGCIVRFPIGRTRLPGVARSGNGADGNAADAPAHIIPLHRAGS